MGAPLTNRTERLARIEQLLVRSTRGMRAVELAEACGVDRRTIYRDISMLNQAGVPINQAYGHFYLDRALYRANIRLNSEETLSLLLAASVVLRQSPQANPLLVQAAQVLAHTLPAELTEHAEYHLASRLSSQVQEVVASVMRAWMERRVIKVRYLHHSGKQRVLEFAIYLVDAKPNGTLYAVGRDMQHDRICRLKLERVQRVKLLERFYQRPAGFDSRIYRWQLHHAAVGQESTTVFETTD
ncbi:MAG: WYL domain-containing protein [bacterium]|nr:WYL domain-containing protein [bacterium]